MLFPEFWKFWGLKMLLSKIVCDKELCVPLERGRGWWGRRGGEGGGGGGGGGKDEYARLIVW